MLSPQQVNTLTSACYNWLIQASQPDFIATLLVVCDTMPFYCMDNQYTIMYWSQGMATLTGLQSDSLIGRVCLPTYRIDDSCNSLIQVLQPNNNIPITLKKISHPVLNRQGDTIGYIVQVIETQASVVSSSCAANVLDTDSQNFYGIVSRSSAMRPVFQIIQNAAATEATVLVRGESGSGKELVAKAIHQLSPRCNQPFLAINCAALSSNLLDSELFGHVKGAFTGAIKDHQGLFRRAHGGTLFLDEVAELPLELQAKLLRVLQERNYIPVGGDKNEQVDVRIVAATHRSLREEVRLGHFREDLMYRLRVVPIFIPPLRERREDICLLIWYFIAKHSKSNIRQIQGIEPEAMQALLDYSWPGNIRELQNVIEYASVVGRGSQLKLPELPPEFRDNKPIASIEAKDIIANLMDQDEKAAMQQALLQTKDVNSAAKLLGMSRATFWRKRKQYGLDKKRDNIG
jgi:transcriptional regulator with PAS, ATPase and Fis domain